MKSLGIKYIKRSKDCRQFVRGDEREAKKEEIFFFL